MRYTSLGKASLRSIYVGLVLTACVGCSPRGLEQDTELGLAGLVDSSAVHLRINLLGYLEDDNKLAVVFSHRKVDAEFDVVDSTTGRVIFTGALQPSAAMRRILGNFL